MATWTEREKRRSKTSLGGKIHRKRFSDVSRKFYQGKWQCKQKQNRFQTAFFGKIPSFDGMLKILFRHLLASRHIWCSSSNVLWPHGLFVASCFQRRWKTPRERRCRKVFHPSPLTERQLPELKSSVTLKLRRFCELIVPWQIKQVFKFWLVASRRNQRNHSSFFDPRSFIDCDMELDVKVWDCVSSGHSHAFSMMEAAW